VRHEFREQIVEKLVRRIYTALPAGNDIAKKQRTVAEMDAHIERVTRAGLPDPSTGFCVLCARFV
jgi:hypothetical protein